MIVPDCQQGQHTRRERAMHGQMRADNAVPILDGTTGSDRPVPHALTSEPAVTRQAGSIASSNCLGCSPRIARRCQAQPMSPTATFSQLRNGLLLTRFHLLRKVQQGRQSQPDLLADPLHLFLHRRRSGLHDFLQQVQHRLHFATA